MAVRESPKSMLQAFIENVPTTVPLKRTRSMARSPEFQSKETAPNRKKRRTRSSFVVQQTPRTMIESYMVQHKTQSPIGRSSRRRSVPNMSNVPSELQDKSMVTPRTAFEGFIDQASDEIPYQKPSKSTEDSDDEDSDADFQIPNETIVITQSPVIDQDSGPITMSQKKKRQNQRHITLHQFSKGLQNHSAAASDETPYQKPSKSTEDSDDEDSDADFQIPNETIVITQSPVIDQDNGPITMSQKEKRQNQHHITLQQFSKGLQNHSAAADTLEDKMFTSDDEDESGVPSSTNLQGLVDSIADTLEDKMFTSDDEDESGVPSSTNLQGLVNSIATPTKENLMIHNRLAVQSPKNRRSNLLQSQTILTPSKQTQALSKDESVTYQNSNRLDLTPSRRARSMLQIENESVLTPSRRTRSMMQIENEPDLTPSRRTWSIMPIGNESDLTPSRRTQSMMQIENESDLTPSRRTRPVLQIENEPDLTPSRRTQSMLQIENESNLTPSRRTRSMMQIENEPDLTPSRRARSVLQIENESDLTPSRRTRSVLQIENEPDLTPSRRARSIMQIENESDLTPSRRKTGTPSKLTSVQIMEEPNHTVSNSTLKSPKVTNTMTSIGKNVEKSQMRSNLDLLEVQNDREEITNISTSPMKERVAQKRHVSSSTPNRQSQNPLSSNITILENIRPLSSSTPARIVKHKSYIGTPSRVPIKPTPQHKPGRTPIKSTPVHTSGRVPIKSTPVHTPGRVPIKSTPVHTPGRVPITTPSSTRHDLVGRNSLRNLANKSSLLTFNNADMSDPKIRNKSVMNSFITNERDKDMNKSKPMSRSTAVEVSTRADDELAEDEGSDDQEESEEDTIDRFKLKTPHLQENISRIPTPIYSSTPASVKQNQLSKPQARPVSKNKQKDKVGSSVLPNSVIKQVFQHFTKMRVIPDTMNELVQFTDTYFKNTFKSLEVFASHARRKTIDDADVELLMKRQGFITDKLPMDVLVENILPLELRQELVPMATAYNIVVPS